MILWCCIHVHRYDDYDYGEVNQLLERGLKLYIKAVACYPDSTKNLLCPLPLVSLKASEKVGLKEIQSLFKNTAEFFNWIGQILI